MEKLTTCLFKKKAWLGVNPLTQKKELKFNREQLACKMPSGSYVSYRNIKDILLNCGYCFYCQQRYSSHWSLRACMEAEGYKENCFLTLTYKNEELPNSMELQKKDYQMFLDRLRKKVYKDTKVKIRYIVSGEYGKKYNTERPHYHIVIFGFVPNDLEFYKESKKKSKLYKSKYISDLWKKGWITVGITVNVKTIKYTIKYMSKFENHESKQQKPFIHMSQGIARNWFINNLDIDYDKKALVEKNKEKYNVLLTDDGEEVLCVKNDSKLNVREVGYSNRIKKRLINFKMVNTILWKDFVWLKSLVFSIYDNVKIRFKGYSYCFPRYFDKLAVQLGFSDIERVKASRSDYFDYEVEKNKEKFAITCEKWFNYIKEYGSKYGTYHIFRIIRFLQITKFEYLALVDELRKVINKKC